MTQNPFRSNGTNAFDLPGGPMHNPPAAQRSDHSLAYDPATKTATPATNAFLELIMKQVGDMMLGADDILEVLEPLLQRIDALEKALQVEVQRSADQIDADVGTFLDEDDAPTASDLAKMMRKHMAQKEARNGNA